MERIILFVVCWVCSSGCCPRVSSFVYRLPSRNVIFVSGVNTFSLSSNWPTDHVVASRIRHLDVFICLCILRLALPKILIEYNYIHAQTINKIGNVFNWGSCAIDWLWRR